MGQPNFETFKYFFPAIHAVEDLPSIGTFVQCEYSPGGKKEVVNREDSYYPEESSSIEEVLTYVRLEFGPR